MLSRSVWIVRRKGKWGTSFALRWVDPATGKQRSESCGTDKKLVAILQARKREELRRGVLCDPEDASWDAFADVAVERIETQKSECYAEDARRVLGLFRMICNPRGPLAVDYNMAQKFINTRLKGVRRCPRQTCRWSNTLGRMTCWKCGADTRDAKNARISPHTVNKDLRTLKVLLADAVKRYRLPKHPLEGVANVEAQPKRIRALSANEQRAVLDACPDIRWRTLFYLAFTTGLRRGELCGLRWEDVDLDGHRLYVHHTKAKRDRTALLTDEAVRLLKELRLTHASPVVFVGDGGHEFYLQVGAGVARIVRAAGIPRFTFHDTRRTFCTDLARAGVNQKVASQLAGHASVATTAKFYQNVDDQMASAAIATLPLARTQTA